jgi:cellulose synthase (UDP-forming)
MLRTASAYSPARPSRRLERKAAREGEPFPLRRRGRARLPMRRELRLASVLVLVTIATLIGAAIRLAVTRGLSLDEIRTAELARLSFGGLITRLAHAGVQPPLHPVLEWLVVRLAGDGDFALRIPSLLAGVALIPVAAWLAEDLFDRRTAIAAALFAAVAPALVWYSQQASGYALVALFGTLAVIGAARAIRRGHAADWVLHVLAASLAVWSDWSGVFIVAAIEVGFAASAVHRRRTGAPLRGFVTAWGLDSLALGCQLAALVGLPLIVFYLSWLLNPARVAQPVLYVMLVCAELLNVIQAVGFWWTCAFERIRERKAPTKPAAVDVLIPRYDEPPEVVELTVAAAAVLRGHDVRVWLLDDGDSEEMRIIAETHGVGYMRRPVHDHAKAGNVNHALARTEAPYVAIIDCDHVVLPEFLEATLGHFEDDDRLAFVQTPQYYANGNEPGVPGAAWHQQTLFFGAIARGKDGLGATFCCGTNVVFRRAALDETGGFPTRSITEDFELSIILHERGWHTAYLPKVLASGLGPEDMAAYTTQQLRWARGCLSALPHIVRARLPWRLRAQYLLSGLYWLSGWTVLFYMAFPLVRILFGVQPLAHLTAPEFLLHFVPYFLIALSTAALAGAGSYTFTALALAAASFWVFITASLLTVARRRGSFKVTPKTGANTRQPRAVAPRWWRSRFSPVSRSGGSFTIVTRPRTTTLRSRCFTSASWSLAAGRLCGARVGPG